MNAKALSVIMGHATIAITFDTDGHLMKGGEAEARERIDGYLDRLDGGTHLRAVARVRTVAAIRKSRRRASTCGLRSMNLCPVRVGRSARERADVGHCGGE